MKLQIAVILGGLFPLFAAHATLGGAASAMSSEANIPAKKLAMTSRPLYKRYEYAQKTSTIHEFEEPHSGHVFGVAWKGARQPDLKTLLGDNFSEYQRAFLAAKAKSHHGSVIVFDTENLHAELGGHMMSVQGHVYLRNQLPNGVTADEVQ